MSKKKRISIGVTLVLALGAAAASWCYLQSRPVQIAPGITRVGDYSYKLGRKELEEILSNQEKMLSSAGAMPNLTDDGKLNGVLLYSVPEDGFFYGIGWREGDVLNVVNDMKLDDRGKMVELVQSLRNFTIYEVQINRKGKNITLTYDVVENRP